MKLSKLFCLFSIIELFLLFYKIVLSDQSIVDVFDIILVLVISIIFLFINKFFFRKNAFLAFILFYIYNIAYLLPFCFILFFPEYVSIIVPKFSSDNYFYKSFLIVFISLVISFYIFFRIKVEKSVILNFNKFFRKEILYFLILTLICNCIFSAFNLFPAFSIFFNPQLYFFLLIFYVCAQIYNGKISNFILLLVYFTIYIFYTILLGSRSGIYNLFIYFFISIFYLFGDFFIKNRYLFLSCILLISSLVLYPVATVFRIAHDDNLSFDFSLFFDSESDKLIVFLFTKIVQRLSLIDYSYIISNNLYSQTFFDVNFSFLNFILSFLNITLPYSFSDNLSSNNLLQNVTFDYSIDQIRDNWSSGNSYIVDFNHLYFPGFELPVTFLVFLLYNYVIKSLSTKYILSSLIYVVLVLKIIELFIFFGYDYFLRNLTHSLVSLFILYFIFVIGSNKKLFKNDIKP